MSFTWPFLLGPVFLWTALSCSDGLSPGEGRDAVRVSCPMHNPLSAMVGPPEDF